MRVTPETQARTRQKLLEAARALFVEDGYAEATTRAIARRAGVATGTLFNYFASKEALGAALLGAAAAEAEAEFDEQERPDEEFEARLFGYVAIQLRHLAPYRSWVAEVLDSGASLLRSSAPDGAAGEGFRLRHLERVAHWLREEAPERESLIDLHLYWTLYLGVLQFWARDDSHNQEATLALLDRSMGLFVRGLDETTERSR